MNFRADFLNYCKTNEFEINDRQLNIIDDIKSFYKENFKQTYLTKIFRKKETKKIFFIFL